MQTTTARVILAAVLAAFLAVGGLAVARAATSARTEIVVFEPMEAGTETWFNLAEQDAGDGAEIGDLLLENKPLLDPASGDEVGRAVTRVQVLDVDDAGPLFNLDCTIQFSDGDIVFYGAGRFGELEQGVTFAVIGGTGRYDDARGTVTVTASELEGTPGAEIAFDLIGRL